MATLAKPFSRDDLFASLTTHLGDRLGGHPVPRRVAPVTAIRPRTCSSSTTIRRSASSSPRSLRHADVHENTDIATTPDVIDQFLGLGHDLVMLDLSLGETDGMRVMRDLGERQPGANLVLLTGADVSVLQGAAKVAELSGFHLVGACGKPASISELEALLRPEHHVRAVVAPVDDLTATVLTALDQGAFYLMYQPIVDLRDGHVRGVEALVRLDVPGKEHVSPELFVHIIEDAGRSLDLLEVVLRTAAHDRATVPAARRSRTSR